MGDVLIENKFLYNLQLQILYVFSLITKLIIFFYIIGVFTDKPVLFENINFVIKVCIALFLVYRFNGYRRKKIEFTELDRKAGYSAGMYILIISFINYYNKYIEMLRSRTQKYINNFYNTIFTKQNFF
jgi:hypothetical protein